MKQLEILAGLKQLSDRGRFLEIWVTPDEIAALAHAIEHLEKLAQQATPTQDERNAALLEEIKRLQAQAGEPERQENGQQHDDEKPR